MSPPTSPGTGWSRLARHTVRRHGPHADPASGADARHTSRPDPGPRRTAPATSGETRHDPRPDADTAGPMRGLTAGSRWYRLAVVVAAPLAAAIAVTVTAAAVLSSPPAPPSSPPASTALRGAATGRSSLTPTGVGAAHLGQGSVGAVAALQQLLGTPRAASPQPDPSCDVSSYLPWPGFSAYFDAGRFVGYATTGSELATARGLRVGDTVAQAQSLYGDDFALSTAQGGSYQLRLPSGQLSGLVDGATATTAPASATIVTIAAGNIGCPGIT